MKGFPPPLKGKAPANPTDSFHTWGANHTIEQINGPGLREFMTDELLLGLVRQMNLQLFRFSRSSAMYRRAWFDLPVYIAAAQARGIMP